MRPLLLSLMIGPAVGCSLDKLPLGDDDHDALALSETAAAYLVDALGADLTLREVFEQGDALAFAARPEPSAFLEATSASDDARSRANKARVPVLTYNVALLDVQLVGIVDYKRTPKLEERRAVLPDLIFGGGAHDVVCLQEVWRDEDIVEFTRKGESLGYRGFAQERDAYNDGVMIFVRAGAVAGGTAVTLEDHEAYASQDGLEFFPGPGIKRGWVEVAFEHAQAGPLRVFCTHMQAFPESWPGRMHQARELGIAARTHSAPDELVVVAGDLNAGPFYKSTEWQPPDGAELQTEWFHNALSYPMLLAYGELVDAAIMGRPLADAAADVALGETVVNDAAESTSTPGAAAGWCESTSHTTFTATDCNALYFEQYAGTEYPARLDHVHVRDRPDLVVAGSRILFTEQQAFGEVVIEPSDHYGVAVELLVDAR